MNARIELITIISSVLIYLIAYILFEKIANSDISFDEKSFRSGLTFFICGIFLLPITALLSIKHYKKIKVIQLEKKSSLFSESNTESKEKMYKVILIITAVIFPFVSPVSILYVSYLFFKL